MVKMRAIVRSREPEIARTDSGVVVVVAVFPRGTIFGRCLVVVVDVVVVVQTVAVLSVVEVVVS